MIETRIIAGTRSYGPWRCIQIRSRKKSFYDRLQSPEDAISQETSITLTVPLLRRALEIRWHAGLGSIPSQIMYFPVLPRETPVFRWCSEGDIECLKGAISRREVSPFVRDQSGKTLLHYASTSCRSEMCLLLVHAGVDANCADDRGRSPLSYQLLTGSSYAERRHSLEVSSKAYEENSLKTLRMLAAASDDISIRDLCNFYSGPSACMQWLLSAYALPQEINGTGMSCPPLHAALRGYGRYDEGYACLIRDLLRRGVDIHSERICARCRKPEPQHFVTALDSLLLDVYDIDHEFDPDGTVRGWLNIVKEAGYDVNAYLEEEMILHAVPGLQSFYTSPSIYFHHRGEPVNRPNLLLFRIGDPPDIWFERWIDPTSPASLVRHEFRYVDTPYYLHAWDEQEWEETWPCRYPYASEDRHYPDFIYPEEWETWRKEWETWRKARNLARRRRDRRWYKKHPEERPCSPVLPAVPGGWVEEEESSDSDM